MLSTCPRVVYGNVTGLDLPLKTLTYRGTPKHKETFSTLLWEVLLHEQIRFQRFFNNCSVNATLLTKAEQGIISQHCIWDYTSLCLRQQLGVLTNSLNWTERVAGDGEAILNTSTSLSHQWYTIFGFITLSKWQWKQQTCCHLFISSAAHFDCYRRE